PVHRLRVAHRRQHHHRHGPPPRIVVQPLEQGQPVHVRHLHVQQDQVRRRLPRITTVLQRLDRLVPAPRRQRVIPLPLQQPRQHVPHHVHVIDHHHRRHSTTPFPART